MADGRDVVAEAIGGWLSGDVPPSSRDRLVDLGRVRWFEPLTEIDREGDETREFGIVRHGRVALRTFVPSRGWVATLTIEPGDVFGWSALVAPHRATATALAIEAVEAVVFDATALRAAVAADHALAAAVYARLLEAVARRLASTRLQLLDLFGAAGYAPW